MSDWDEDAFDEIYRSILNDHLEVSKPLVLGHLRKAKADGMREAALLAEFSKVITRSVVYNEEEIPSKQWIRDPTALEIGAAIRGQADKIEKGE